MEKIFDFRNENQRVLPIFYKNFAVGTSRPDLIVKDDNGGEKIKAPGYSFSLPQEDLSLIYYNYI
jgi:hypothetical protein